jgi:hypothetical protein
MPDTAFKPVSDQAGRMVESSWKRILAIAQNHVQDFENNSTASLDSTSEFYDRERHMVHALDTLFSLAYEGRT